MTDELSPRPDPAIEPGQPAPGGPDAMPASTDGVDNEEATGDPAPRDLDPEKNPQVEDALPDEMKQSEDTDTAATKGEDAPDEEAPA